MHVPLLTFLFAFLRHGTLDALCSPVSSFDRFSGVCISVSVLEDSIFHCSDFTGVACERELIQLERPH